MYAYFTVATARLRKNKELYSKIIKCLEEYDINNSNDYIGAIMDDKIFTLDQIEKDSYNKALKRIKKSSLLIADISSPSVAIGALIEYTINKNIPVLSLYNSEDSQNVPVLLRNYKSNLFSLISYTPKTVEQDLTNFLNKFKANKIKFNMFVSSDIDNYLDWYSKTHKLSKADFLRNLIKNHMDSDFDYGKQR